jgi:hypothetical protein
MSDKNNQSKNKPDFKVLKCKFGWSQAEVRPPSCPQIKPHLATAHPPTPSLPSVQSPGSIRVGRWHCHFASIRGLKGHFFPEQTQFTTAVK